MQIKFLIRLISIVSIVAFCGCDKIDPPYREDNGGASTEGVILIGTDSAIINGDTIAFPADNSTPAKKVLAEDYTGALCGNCPYAGLLLNDTIKPLYNDRLVIISVHAGFFAKPCPNGLACPGTQPSGSFETDFRTATGNSWDGFFGNGSAGNPNGLIDRMDYPTTQHIKYPTVWATKIQERSNLSAPFAIRIKNIYDPGTRELEVAIQTRAIGNQNGTYKISIVLAEDSVIDWQLWYPPHTTHYDSTYAHRNVMRTSYNSAFGEEIHNGAINSGELTLRAFSSVIDPAWQANHCRIIAFIFDADTYEVKQVEEVSAQ